MNTRSQDIFPDTGDTSHYTVRATDVAQPMAEALKSAEDVLDRVALSIGAATTATQEQEWRLAVRMAIGGIRTTFERISSLSSAPASAHASSQRANEFVVITAASQWACERTVNDWDEADLMKAIASMNGDWPGCEECDHDCDEPCMPHTVADVHADVDARLAQLVHERKLIAPTGYTPPAGWKPVAMPETRRRPKTVNDELQTSFCDTLDGTRWRRLIAFRDVSAERNRQDEQWGGAANDDTNSVIDWQNCIHKQIRQLAQRAERRERLVKIAALAIAAIESHDRIADSPKGGAA